MWRSRCRIRLGHRLRKASGEADALRPREAVVGGEAELHPHVVGHEVVERQVRQAALLRVADHGFGPVAVGRGPARRCRCRAGR